MIFLLCRFGRGLTILSSVWELGALIMSPRKTLALDEMKFKSWSFGSEGSLFATGHRAGLVVVSCFGSLGCRADNQAFLQLWSLPGRKPLWEVGDQEESIHSLAFTNQDSMLVSGSERTQVWNVETGALLHTFEGPSGRTLIGLPNHPAFLSTSNSERVGVIYDAEHGRLHPFPGRVHCGVAAPDGLSSLTCGFGNNTEVFIWDHRPLLETWGQGLKGKDVDGDPRGSIVSIAGPLDSPLVGTPYFTGEVLMYTWLFLRMTSIRCRYRRMDGWRFQARRPPVV